MGLLRCATHGGRLLTISRSYDSLAHVGSWQGLRFLRPRRRLVAPGVTTKYLPIVDHRDPG